MTLPQPYRLGKCLLLATCSALPLAAGAEKVTYEDHVFPIFEQACTNCHNPDKKKGDLDLTSYPGTMAGGSSGKIAVPGDGGGSRLYSLITHTEEPVMPPKGDKLEKKQADVIRAWIDGGLLETKSSTAKKADRPKIELAVNVDPASKPEGPPPMPADLSLEPAVVGIRAGIVKDMAYSPWAPLLAVTGQKQVLLYNTDSLRLAGILPFPAGQPEVLSFHPSGQYLLAGGGIPGKSGTTITWEIKTGKEVVIAGKEFDSVIAAGLRPDLGGVTTGGPSRLVKLWDTQSGEQFKSIKKHTDWVTSLAYSPDGVLLATGGRGGGAYVWEAATGNEFHTLRAHQKALTAISWRADSNVLATASEDGNVIFWEMNDGKQVKKLAAHGSGVLAFDYARDGHFATSGRDKRVKIWKPDFNLKKELPAFKELVVEVAFSHDGKRLFTADYSGKLEAWDCATFAKVGELNGNPPRIADRLAWYEKELKAAPAAVKAAEEKLKASEAAVAKARQAHQDAVARRDGAKQNIARLKQELAKLGAEAKQLEARRNQLAGPRQQREKALQVSENSLNDHRQALEGARRELANAAPPANPRAEEEKKLVAEAQKCR
ncbi:MAG: hypothetical protein HKO57_12920, partial [Akkermansiaceae bacterium]|nr:hypothetical protein [Akkermansiaceae bacterium]